MRYLCYPITDPDDIFVGDEGESLQDVFNLAEESGYSRKDLVFFEQIQVRTISTCHETIKKVNK